MIPKECKRLAEVDFPIAVVSKHSAREKTIRYGHPSTLHLWWARRPLAACRAMLMALLLPDPCDPQCPAQFKSAARDLFTGSMLAGKPPKTDSELRARILGLIGDFADWDNLSHSVYLEIARGLVKAAYPDETPLVADPFAGGGSIPLEALRIGCDAFASDLNPVACLINKVLLEDVPRHGPKLAEELRVIGAEVKKAAEKELAKFYPLDPDGGRPIAYLWARVVRCEAPNCGAEIPLIRSYLIRKKERCVQALRPVIVRKKGAVPEVRFEIVGSWSASTWRSRGGSAPGDGRRGRRTSSTFATGGSSSSWRPTAGAASLRTRRSGAASGCRSSSAATRFPTGWG
jgi:adenine-specific DNA methylase